MADLEINVADVNKDVTARVMIDAAQVRAIIAEWLRGQGITVKSDDIHEVYDSPDWETKVFDGFSFPLPMSVKFKAPCT